MNGAFSEEETYATVASIAAQLEEEGHRLSVIADAFLKTGIIIATRDPSDRLLILKAAVAEIEKIVGKTYLNQPFGRD